MRADFHWTVRQLRGRITPHFLDFENFPAPFKTYDYFKQSALPKPDLRVASDLDSLFGPEQISESDGIDKDRIARGSFPFPGRDRETPGKQDGFTDFPLCRRILFFQCLRLDPGCG